MFYAKLRAAEESSASRMIQARHEAERLDSALLELRDAFAAANQLSSHITAQRASLLLDGDESVSRCGQPTLGPAVDQQRAESLHLYSLWRREALRVADAESRMLSTGAAAATADPISIPLNAHWPLPASSFSTSVAEAEALCLKLQQALDRVHLAQEECHEQQARAQPPRTVRPAAPSTLPTVSNRPTPSRATPFRPTSRTPTALNT